MRGKVNLNYIVNESTRKESYMKRKMVVLNNLEGLTTLCEIDACGVIYSEFHPEPVIWPSPSEFQRVVTKFRSYSESEQGKKMVNQESFLVEKILKAQKKITKVQKKNREMESSLRMFKLMANGNIINNMNNFELNDMAWIIDEKMKHVNHRIIELDNQASTSENQAQVPNPIVTDGAVKQVEAQVNHGQSYEMNMNITHNFTSFLNHING